jgi:hypothetical protein
MTFVDSGLKQCYSLYKGSISSFINLSLTISIPFDAAVSQVTGIIVGYRHDIVSVNMFHYKFAGCTLTDKVICTL